MKLQTRYLLILAIWPHLSWAITTEGVTEERLLCPSYNNTLNQYIAPASFDEQKKDETRISAEKVENAAGDISTFSGQVLIERDQLRLQANTVTYNRLNQILKIDGDIHIDTNNLSIEGDSGWLNLDKNSGEFTNSHYFFPETHFQGSTPMLSMEKNKHTLIIDSRFSSCPRN